MVDDGCPEGSGDAARHIVEEENLEECVRVLYLQDAIDAGLPPAASLASTDDSRKGGSIRYGLWEAVRGARPPHVLLFTDADLSTHLGQSGLLLHPILAGGAEAAIGSRREPTSVVVKEGARNTRGKLFIYYLWKRLLPQLRGIVDTQCGFKAFRPGALEGWFRSAVETGFAFDIEMLLHVHLRGGRIEKVPVAWIDSDALSTTADLDPYLDMLHMVVRFYRTYLPPDPTAESFATLIEALDRASFDLLLEHMPPSIADAEPASFDAFDGVTAGELARAAGLSV